MFKVLASTDSTNNYAMALVHAGLAKHGNAWFARDQTAGKGQQGKRWESKAGENIALSIAIRPAPVFYQHQFYFIALISNTCYDFFQGLAGERTSIKWPNDLYWRDRKAGGILIENKFMGKIWKWAVVGIGININQDSFPDELPNPVSLKMITGKDFDPETLAKQLYHKLMNAIEQTGEGRFGDILSAYNQHLYCNGKVVKFKKGSRVFETLVKGVNPFGQLITEGAVEELFDFGEVQWLIRPED